MKNDFMHYASGISGTSDPQNRIGKGFADKWEISRK